MMELLLTGLVAVGVPMWLAIEEMLQQRKARRHAPETRAAEAKPEPESRRAAAVAVVSLSRTPARAGYAG